MEFPVSDSGRVHRDSETGATGLLESENPASLSLLLRPFRRVLFSALLCALCVSALSSPAFAQGCALCYESARASANPGAINHGILVLLVPTLLMFAGVLVFTIRRAHSQQ